MIRSKEEIRAYNLGLRRLGKSAYISGGSARWGPIGG